MSGKTAMTRIAKALTSRHCHSFHHHPTESRESSELEMKRSDTHTLEMTMLPGR